MYIPENQYFSLWNDPRYGLQVWYENYLHQMKCRRNTLLNKGRFCFSDIKLHNLISYRGTTDLNQFWTFPILSPTHSKHEDVLWCDSIIQLCNHNVCRQIWHLYHAFEVHECSHLRSKTYCWFIVLKKQEIIPTLVYKYYKQYQRIITLYMPIWYM